MNYGEIRDLFDEYFGTDTDFGDAALLAWANQAVEELAVEARALEMRRALEVAAGEQAVDFPSDLHKIRRVAYDGTVLDRTQMIELQEKANKWDEDRGTPRHWFTYGFNEQIGLWPIPSADTIKTTGTVTNGVLVGTSGVLVDTADGAALPDAGAVLEVLTGNELEVFYYARPPKMVSSADVPELPGWLHPTVAYYMLRSAFAAITHKRDLEKAVFWGRLYMHGKYRLKCRANGRLPKKWRVTGPKAAGAPIRYGRLPQVVDV